MSMAIDYSQWQTWEDVTTPSGGKYKRVPGTGYVYDPFLSSQKKRPVLWLDPTKANEERAKIQRQAEQAASPLGQAIPVASGVAGVVGSKYLINKLGLETGASAASGTGSAAAASAPTAAGGFQAGLTGSQAITASTPGIPGLSGGTPLVNGQVPASPTVGGTLAAAQPYLGAAAAVYGTKGVIDAIDANDPKAGAISGVGAGLGLGMAAPLLGFGPLGWGALALMGAGGGLLGGGLTAALGKPSTKEIQAGRWADVGRSDLAANANRDYFAGTGGEKSRDEKFLTVDAIRVNPDTYRAAPDFDKWSKAAQDEFLGDLLANDKVDERKGGIYYDDEYAKNKANEIRKKYEAQTQGKEIAQRMDRKNKRK